MLMDHHPVLAFLWSTYGRIGRQAQVR